MSDPVSNAEVEDVLASIRRLVSEESRGEAQRGLRAQAPDAPGEADAGKLVLTPSLRVMEPPEDAPDSDVDVDAEAAQDSGADAPAVQGGAPADDTAPEAAEAAPGADQTATLDGETGGGGTDEDARAALPVRGLQAVRDGDEDAGTPVQEGSDWPALQPDAPRFDDGAPAMAGRLADEARSNPLSLSAKIAALEAAVGRRSGEAWEPDGVRADEPLSGTEPPALDWEDHVAAPSETGASETPEVTQLPPRQGSRADASVLADMTEEPALLDEEALHDMVAEIVRQELQGALGERITRNVRKLVRREIQRALAAHDLD